MTVPFVPGKDSRKSRASASAEKIRRVQEALDIPTDGTEGPYTSTLPPEVLSQLNSREKEKLEIEFGRLKVSGRQCFFASRQMEEGQGVLVISISNLSADLFYPIFILSLHIIFLH